jgi:hypothetical protein
MSKSIKNKIMPIAEAISDKFKSEGHMTHPPHYGKNANFVYASIKLYVPIEHSRDKIKKVYNSKFYKDLNSMDEVKHIMHKNNNTLRICFDRNFIVDNSNEEFLKKLANLFTSEANINRFKL